MPRITESWVADNFTQGEREIRVKSTQGWVNVPSLCVIPVGWIAHQIQTHTVGTDYLVDFRGPGCYPSLRIGIYGDVQLAFEGPPFDARLILVLPAVAFYVFRSHGSMVLKCTRRL